ncbi:MAG: glycosyltransferase [Magnetococcales bacterium]|nr:glycosyltransferase [Magnetococcales bacterium]NGZ27585.1 glycosyltransferase [Magnetococcales bacterium]
MDIVNCAVVNPPSPNDLRRWVAMLKQAEANNHLQGIVDVLKNIPLTSPAAMALLISLLAEKGVASAWQLAKLLHGQGVGNEVSAFAEGLGESLFGQPDAFQHTVQRLGHLADGLPAPRLSALYEVIKVPLRDIGLDAFRKQNHDLILRRLLPLMQAAVPAFRTLLDLQAPVPTVDLSRMAEEGAQRAKLLNFPCSDGQNRRPRRALVAVRKIVLGKREFEFGPFFTRCLRVYGWHATFFGIEMTTANAIYQQLSHQCQEMQPEVIFLDLELMLLDGNGRALFFELMIQLRRIVPGVKIVALYFDVHYLDKAVFDVASAMSDLSWTLGGTDNLYREMDSFSNRVYCPLVSEDSFRGQLLPLKESIHFSGRVFNVNWHRLFWLAAVENFKLPITVEITPPQLPQQTDILQDYKNYNQRIAESCGCLNFSMRDNLHCSFTGRPFEVILNRSLLVQERNPVMDYYFVAGEHYLEFSSFAQLRGILHLLQEQPAEVEKVRQRGFAFAQGRYSNEKIIGHLEQRLFG